LCAIAEILSAISRQLSAFSDAVFTLIDICCPQRLKLKANGYFSAV